MRYKIFTLFTALTLSAGALFASDTAVDGIYYYFDDANRTAAVTYRGDYPGEYNAYTGDVVIPATVTYGGNTYSVTCIRQYAFYGCSGLTSVTIPNSVTSIEYEAFCGCSGLTSVTIPNSVTSIGGAAFAECSGLTSVTIPNSVTSIGEDAFYGTAWLANQPDGVIYINQSLNTYKGEMPANTSIVVRDGTTQICDYAFSGCSGLTSVTIPNSVTSIGEYAFGNCTQLTNIVCYAAEPPSCGASSFANYNVFLKVPCNNLMAYQTHVCWGSFKYISCIGSTVGLEQIELAGLYTQAGRIVCDGEFRIYDLLGRDVTRLNGSLQGVYVVKTANAAQKVIVK